MVRIVSSSRLETSNCIVCGKEFRKVKKGKLFRGGSSTIFRKSTSKTCSSECAKKHQQLVNNTQPWKKKKQ